jgi:hypothetical protein
VTAEDSFGEFSIQLIIMAQVRKREMSVKTQGGVRKREMSVRTQGGVRKGRCP